MPCFRLLGNSRFMRSALPALTLVACALLPQAALAGARFEVPDYLLRLPEQTYRLIEHNFSTLYQQTDFTPANHQQLFQPLGSLPLRRHSPGHHAAKRLPDGGVRPALQQVVPDLCPDEPGSLPLSHPAGGHDGDQSDEIAIGMGLGIP